MPNIEDPISRITSKMRRRPVVPPRNTSLVGEESPRVYTEVEPTVHSAVVDDLTIFEQQETSEKTSSELTLELQNTSIRIEQHINLDLRSMCLKEGVTKDTFLEAAYIICTENPALLEQVLKEASRRTRIRRDIGNDRKAQSWSKRLSK